MKRHDTIDVLIGGYLSKDAAEEDYERGPRAAAGTCRAPWSSARTSRATSRSSRPITWFARGREGLGAVGFAVGLFAPPLLAATAIGAAMGAGAGALLHHKTADKIGEQAGATIPIGGAGLIVAYSHSEAAKVEPAVTRAVQKAIGEAEGSHVKALKGALADAQQKMAEGRGLSPMADSATGRSRLRRRHRHVDRYRRRDGGRISPRRVSTSSPAFGARWTGRRCRAQTSSTLTPLIIDVTDEKTISAAAVDGGGRRRRPRPRRTRQQRGHRQACSARVPADGGLPNAARGQPVRTGRHDPGLPAARSGAAAAGSSTSGRSAGCSSCR